MNILKTWLEGERGRSIKLAKHLDCWPTFVFKMAAGQKPVPIHHAAAIELFTGGAVTRKDMFPDTWQRIWPELVAPSFNQAKPTGQGDSQ